MEEGIDSERETTTASLGPTLLHAAVAAAFGGASFLFRPCGEISFTNFHTRFTKNCLMLTTVIGRSLSHKHFFFFFHRLPHKIVVVA